MLSTAVKGLVLFASVAEGVRMEMAAAPRLPPCGYRLIKNGSGDEATWATKANFVQALRAVHTLKVCNAEGVDEMNSWDELCKFARNKKNKDKYVSVLKRLELGQRKFGAWLAEQKKPAPEPPAAGTEPKPVPEAPVAGPEPEASAAGTEEPEASAAGTEPKPAPEAPGSMQPEAPAPGAPGAGAGAGAPGAGSRQPEAPAPGGAAGPDAKSATKRSTTSKKNGAAGQTGLWTVTAAAAYAVAVLAA